LSHRIGHNEDQGHAWFGQYYCYMQGENGPLYLHRDGTWGNCVRAEDVYYSTEAEIKMVLEEMTKPPKRIIIDVEI
jgi:hypothetical protein